MRGALFLFPLIILLSNCSHLLQDSFSYDTEDTSRTDDTIDDSEQYSDDENNGIFNSKKNFKNLNRDFLPHQRYLYNKKRNQKEDFIDKDIEGGSLWASNGQVNYFFSKNKSKNIGDLVLLKVNKELYSEIYSFFDKNLTPQEQWLGKKYTFYEQNKNQLEKNKITSIDSLNKEIEKIKMNPQLIGLKEGDTLVGEVINKQSNGNYEIRVGKKITYEFGRSRNISVFGIVRQNDIYDENDLIQSENLYGHYFEIYL